ncbi:hypothetical protein [Halorussus caseinilyticus]|uniref:Restriction endonuclease n=1 Tax=Halorussus caseinilyticus TaxID=3034025 RepID=A0ABD5WIS2_9EURY
MAIDVGWEEYLEEYEKADEYVPVSDTDWYEEHSELYQILPSLLEQVPTDFESDVHIEGLDATDVFGLNEVLASSVENQVTETLNSLKSEEVDFPSGYENYDFVRQSQTFPDIVFQGPVPDEDPVIGIELKGFYLLAKEGDPSFRFGTTPDACAPQDLLVVYPWVLDNLVTGSPEIFRPFIMPAKFASLFVDYYWKELKNWDADKPDKSIKRPEGDISPYPNAKSDFVQDHAEQDSGGNYGRFRSKSIKHITPLQEYMNQMKSRELLGISAEKWGQFFTGFEESDRVESWEDVEGIAGTYAENLEKQGWTLTKVKTQLVNELNEMMDDVDGIGVGRAENILNAMSKVELED